MGWIPEPGSGGVSDHGELDGLADDDHTQYLNTARHAAIDAADHGSGAATAGQVLTADGAGGAAWKDPTGGGAFAETIGDNSNTSFQVTHSLGSTDVVVQLWDLTGAEPIEATGDASQIKIDDDNNITVTFSAAPATDSYRVVILSSGGESGGGGGGGLLGEVEASTDVNFLELEIPSGATDVRLTGLLRITVNSTFGMVYATVGNGTVDTGSNYKWGYHWVNNRPDNGADLNATDSKIDLGGGNFPGTNSPAGVFAVLDMLIPGYDDTTRDKFMSWTVRKWRADSGSTRFVFAQGWAMWDSTAAIDVIRFTPESGQIAAGSVIRAFAG